MRRLLVGVLAVGCAGRGGAAQPEPVAVAEPTSDDPRYGMCVGYRAVRASPTFVSADVLLRQAGADYDAGRDEAAAQGYLAAAGLFHAVIAAEPRHVEAHTNMRVAYADAALVWLEMKRPEAARAALEQAQAHDHPTMAEHWQQEITRLPRAPSCNFKLEPAFANPTPEPEAPAPEVVAPAEPAEPVVHAACGKVERGKLQKGHEFVGATVAELDERGGEILCGRDPVWQLRFGTLCGDVASFHEVITVEVQAGKVRRVWAREQYNAAFCNAGP